MSKWQKLMEKYGISETNPPGSIKKQITTLSQLKKNLAKIEEKLNGDISDDKRRELQEERNEWADSIEAQEEVIEETIEKYEKNKDMYAEKMRAMKEAVAKKKAAESGTKTEVKEEVKDEPPAAPEGVVVETPAPKVETVKAEVIEPKPEKKGMSTGTKLVLGGLFLVLSFGAYNYFANKDE